MVDPVDSCQDISTQSSEYGPHGGTGGKVRGSSKSLRFILRGPLMAVSNFIQPIVVEIFPPPKKSQLCLWHRVKVIGIHPLGDAWTFMTTHPLAAEIFSAHQSDGLTGCRCCLLLLHQPKAGALFEVKFVLYMVEAWAPIITLQKVSQQVQCVCHSLA